MEPIEKNICDQRWHEFYLYDVHKVKVIRKHLLQVYESSQLTEDKRLFVYVELMCMIWVGQSKKKIIMSSSCLSCRKCQFQKHQLLSLMKISVHIFTAGEELQFYSTSCLNRDFFVCALDLLSSSYLIICVVEMGLRLLWCTSELDSLLNIIQLKR